MEVDRSGNVYLTGTTACCTPGYKMYVTKFDSLGNILWNTIIYDSAHIYAYTWESTIDDSANVYLTAETQDTSLSTGYDCAVAKVDSAGNQNWFTVYNSSSNPNIWEESKDIITNFYNDVYVAGWIENTQGSQDAFILKIKGDGNISWVKVYNGNANNGDGFNSLICDSMQNVVATGSATLLPLLPGITGGLLVISYDSSGSENWRIEKPGTYYGLESIILNKSLFATGQTLNIDPSFSDDSLFVFKYGDLLLTQIISIKPYEFYLSAFPNPIEAILTIISYNQNNESAELKIFDSAGQIVYGKEIKSVKIISTAGWPTGLYFVQIRSDEYITSKKIIKQ